MSLLDHTLARFLLSSCNIKELIMNFPFSAGADMKKKFSLNIKSVGGRLIFFQAVSIFVLLSILAIAAGELIERRFVASSTRDMTGMNMRVMEMIDAYNLKLKEHTISLAGVLIEFNNAGSGSHILTQDEIDRFTAITGAVATHFIREGDDFRRINTSLRKQDGSRAIGTLLDRNHPGYTRVISGENYTGPAVLFGRNYMTHYVPVKRGDEVVGIYFVGLDFTEGITNLKNKIRAIKVAKSGYIFVAEGKAGLEPGLVVIHPSDKLEGKNLYELKDSDGNDFVKKMISEQNGVMRYKWQDDTHGGKPYPKYVSYNYYWEWNWLIASSAAEEELLADGLALRNYIFAGFLVSTIVILLVLFGAVKKIITLKLRKLNAIVKDLSGGEGDLTVRLDFAADDEIGEIAGGFNSFLDKLELMISEVVRSGQNLVADVESIRSENLNLSKRTTEQAESLEEVAATLEEITSSIVINSENAHKAKETAEQGAKQADEGNQASVEAVNAINEISASSMKVVETLNFIRDITFQTNLLALNAAVEAARAGEHGRGFAVVAGEVRSLAQRSADAARDIEEITRNSVTKVEEGIVMVNRTGDELKEIEQSSRETASLIVEISTSTEEQRISMMQINQAVSALDSMTQQNAALVEKTAAGSNKMAEQARGLLHMLERFKISKRD